MFECPFFLPFSFTDLKVVYTESELHGTLNTPQRTIDLSMIDTTEQEITYSIMQTGLEQPRLVHIKKKLVANYSDNRLIVSVIFKCKDVRIYCFSLSFIFN